MKYLLILLFIVLTGCSSITPMRTDLNNTKIQVLNNDLINAKTLEDVQLANAKMMVINAQLDRELQEDETYLYEVSRNPGRSFVSFIALPFTFFKFLPLL